MEQLIMIVTSFERTNHGTDRLTSYGMDTGHEVHKWDSGAYFVYTKSGNFASQQTMHKALRAINEYRLDLHPSLKEMNS